MVFRNRVTVKRTEVEGVSWMYTGGDCFGRGNEQLGFIEGGGFRFQLSNI
jgi:hypothetical protein